MTTEARITYTSTGAKSQIDISPQKTVSFSTTGDAADYTADVEVLLTKNGNWTVAESGIADSTVRVTQGPIKAIRLNISSLGTATTIDFEVLDGNF